MRHAASLEAFEEFLPLWEALLREARHPSTVIVVEGERDRASLRRLGVEGRIVLVHRGQRLAVVAEEIGRRARRVIVLTDWDPSGGRLAQRLKEFLSAGPAELDLGVRRSLALVLRGEVVHVEGLFHWARRMAERAGAPLEQFAPDPSDGDRGPTG